MTDIGTLQNQLETIVREKFRRHVCAIWYLDADKAPKIGTGNLIKHNGDIFVLTCNHIVKEAMITGSLEINFTNSTVLGGKQISLARKHEREDIALLKVNADTDLRDLVPLTIDDFMNSTNLKDVCNDQAVFVVVGFPGDLVKHDHLTKISRLIPLFYQTVNLPNKRSTITKIYLEYPYGKEDGLELPRAFGLSGAGIWIIPPLFPSNDIWSPTSLKMVAIQYAWKEGKYSDKQYIVGSRVSRVVDWLKGYRNSSKL